ncbi:hypothetical protein M5D96_009738 [Drosophila gunungcola]|uniref:Uncharacterized protein n=1 Tax=Drosophila gunungcola TaxID=103775 RepID=A0A9P9YJ81_9MUSC|nr:hypothetical protein M5D96_009738 [Drosophila gunungcola]
MSKKPSQSPASLPNRLPRQLASPLEEEEKEEEDVEPQRSCQDGSEIMCIAGESCAFVRTRGEIETEARISNECYMEDVGPWGRNRSMK